MGGNGEDIVDDNGEDGHVAIPEALGIDARVTLGAKEAKLGGAAVEMAVPQQGRLLETIHIEHQLQGMASRDGDAFRRLKVHALMRGQDAI